MHTIIRSLLLVLGVLLLFAGCEKPKPVPFAIRHHIESLGNKEAFVRWTAAKALGEMGTKAAPAIKTLVKTLSDPHWLVQAHAIQALTRIGSPAVKAICKELDKHNLSYRSGHQTALARLAKDMKTLILPCLRKRATQRQGRARSWALDAMTLFGFSSIPVLRSLLRSKENDLRASTVRAFRQLGPLAKQVERDLIKLLNDPAAYVRRQAANTLAALKSDSPALRKQLERLIIKDTTIRVRIDAALALATTSARSPQAIEALLELIQEPGIMTYFQYRALGPLGKLTHQISTTHPKLTQKVVRYLTETLQHRMSSLRFKSIKALGTIGLPARHASITLLAMAKKNGHMQKLLIRTLKRITTPSDRVVFLRSTDPEIRSLALRLFAHPPDQKLLQKALQDAASSVRKQAVLLLTKTSQVAPFQAMILPIATRDPNAATRASAIRWIGMHWKKLTKQQVAHKQPTSRPTSAPTILPHSLTTKPSKPLTTKPSKPLTTKPSKPPKQTPLRARIHSILSLGISADSLKVFAAATEILGQQSKHEKKCWELLRTTLSREKKSERLNMIIKQVVRTKRSLSQKEVKKVFEWAKKPSLELSSYHLLGTQVEHMNATQQAKLLDWYLMILRRGKRMTSGEYKVATRGFVNFGRSKKRTRKAFQKQVSFQQKLMIHPQGYFRGLGWFFRQQATLSKRKKMAKQAMTALLTDPCQICQLQAARLLFALPVSQKISQKVWSKAILERQSAIRMLALEAIRKRKIKKSLLPALMLLVWAKEPQGESRAIELIGKFGYKAKHALPLLLKRQDASMWYIRLNVLHALNRIDRKAANVQQATLKATKDRDPRVRKAAQQLLSQK